jgi:predicted nucleic-acid-binding protein
MAAVDTNVLVRLLLDDDEEQGRAARTLQKTHAPLFVSHVVLVELTWVLKAAYGFTRAKLDAVVDMLLDTEGLLLQEPGIVRSALVLFRGSRAEFSDCMILAIAESAGAGPLATFDDKLSKLPQTRRLGRKRSRSR